MCLRRPSDCAHKVRVRDPALHIRDRLLGLCRIADGHADFSLRRLHRLHRPHALHLNIHRRARRIHAELGDSHDFLRELARGLAAAHPAKIALQGVARVLPPAGHLARALVHRLDLDRQSCGELLQGTAHAQRGRVLERRDRHREAVRVLVVAADAATGVERGEKRVGVHYQIVNDMASPAMDSLTAAKHEIEADIDERIRPYHNRDQRHDRTDANRISVHVRILP